MELRTQSAAGAPKMKVCPISNLPANASWSTTTEQSADTMDCLVLKRDSLDAMMEDTSVPSGELLLLKGDRRFWGEDESESVQYRGTRTCTCQGLI